jgi:hypothetical protein
MEFRSWRRAMLAAGCVLATLAASRPTLAQAAVLQVTLDVRPEGVKLLRATLGEGDLPSAPGELAILDARGEVLANAPMPMLTTQRAVITPEGHDAAPHKSTLVRARLPWPEGAAAIQAGGDLLRPAFERSHQLPPPAEVVKLRDSGPPHRRLDLVVLADGYTIEQRPKFIRDTERIIAHLDTLEPFDRYSSLVNVWAAFTPSIESGTDDGEPTDGVGALDTAFECFSTCEDISRLICCDEAEILTQIDAIAPFADGVLVLANTDRYGGSGGFNYAVSYTGSLATDVASHELAHSLVLLWDEYSYGTPQDPQKRFISPNCAKKGEIPPWEVWIGPDHPEIGVFDGCSFTDWVRPTANTCMMGSLALPYCPVCREHIVVSMYESVGGNLIEHADPLPGEPVVLPTGGSVTFDVHAIETEAPLTWTWTLDGEVISTTAGPLELPHQGDCESTLTLRIADETDWVRNDPEAWLAQEVSWPLAPAPCTVKQGCGCDGAAGNASSLAAMATLAALARRRRGSW